MPPRAPACQIGALVKWWAMEMQQLRYFLAVLEHGSFSRAADDLGRSQQAISRAIQTLLRRRLIRRVADQRDRRSYVLRLTAEGRRILDESVPPMVAWEKRMLSALTRDEQQALAKLLARVVEASPNWPSSLEQEEQG